MGITTSNLEFMHENFQNFVNADELLKSRDDQSDSWLDADQDDQDE